MVGVRFKVTVMVIVRVRVRATARLRVRLRIRHRGHDHVAGAAVERAAKLEVAVIARCALRSATVGSNRG